MSPRRWVLAAVLLVLLVAVGVVALARGDDVVAPTRRGVAQDKPGPVLLVPGYGGGTGGLEQLAARLRAAGRTATVVALPGNGTGDLRVQAGALALAARAALAAGAPSVDVVGYSAGGVVARLWARSDGGAKVARRVVTLGSPHHGTSLAVLGAALDPGACRAACQQLMPGSDVLTSLDRGDETPAGPRWVSIWTDQDQVVTPPDSSRLAGALDVVVQSVCRGRPVDHGALPTDAVVQGLVLRMLGPGPPSAPSAADCAQLSRG
ncbi:MAG: triacylglycerol lipase [Actinomycetota bacterium]|jgi:triacylglycerol esterase/lipase EstA (alpha/beta hydrolase family)|nr:triacylglycerol lipase [Actinomycetota bacterium]